MVVAVADAAERPSDAKDAGRFSSSLEAVACRVTALPTSSGDRGVGSSLTVLTGASMLRSEDGWAVSPLVEVGEARPDV